MRNFLERPVLYLKGTWTGAQVQLDTINSRTIPDIANESTMIRGKMDDFRFFKATINFRVVVNAQPFAVGRVIVWWSPLEDARGAYAPVISLPIITGYPNVEVDAGSGNEAVLKVPFAYPYAIYDLKAQTNPEWGTLRITVMNPLGVASGSNTAEVTVYRWYSNVVLSTPAPTAVGQGETESEVTGHEGLISAPAGKVEAIASAIGKFPLGPVSEVANAVSWVAKITKGVAEAFGYSKPPSDEAIKKICNFQAAGLTNYNGVDNSVTLGYNYENSLDVNTKVFGSCRDEMDISYVCSRSCYMKEFTWATTAVTGDILTQWQVHPGICLNVDGTYMAPTLLAYVANMFAYWRGGIQYRVSFVKNNFYSGRIAFAFVSGDTVLTSPVDTAEMEAAPKVICDIRDNGECLLTVPYLSRYAWQRSQTLATGTVGSTFSAGLVVAYVINPLKANDNTVSTITANVYVRGDTDIEFAMPIGSYSRVLLGPIPSPLKKKDKLKRRAVGQMYKTQKPIELKDVNDAAGKEMFEKSVLRPFEGGKLAMGEKIVNLRCLTRMFSPITPDAVSPFPKITLDASGWFGNGVLVSGNHCRYHIVGGIYVMHRGAMRVKALPYNFDTGTSTFALNAYTDTYAGAPFEPTDAYVDTGSDQLRFVQPVNTNNTPFLEVSLPYYQIQNAAVRTTSAQGNFRNVVTFEALGGTSSFAGTFYQACGDDFTFGLLVGPPLLVQ